MDKKIYILPLLALLFSVIYSDNKLIRVSRYKIKSDKVPKEFDKFKIIHLSDLHNYKFNKNNTKIINKIDNERPDIIVITGDMVNKYDKDFDIFLDLAQTLGKRYKIYYIVGNHEKRLKKEYLDYIIAKLKIYNINVINDKKITLIRNKERIHIYGLDLPLSFYRVKNKPTNIDEVVGEILNNCDENEYNILLVHNPLFFESYAKYNVSLILAGHVHGGMIRLPFIGGLLSPERKFFPKYCSGIYEKNNKKLIVSRGLSQGKPCIRINNIPEIASITLLS